MNVTHFESQYEAVYYVWLDDGREGTMRGDGHGEWFEHTFQEEPPYVPGED